MIKKQKIIIDHLHGPLEVSSSFNYTVKSIKACDTTEIVKYSIKNYNEYEDVFDRKTANEHRRESIFTRIIRINMDYVSPIIGLLYVIGDNSYYIGHLSVHNNFRRQGLAKMMLSSLAEFIKVDNRYKTVSLTVHRDNTDAIDLYESIGFKNVDNKVYTTMEISTTDFIESILRI